MKVDLDNIEVFINEEANRFEARVEEYLCIIDFIPAEQVLVVTHTEVPPVLGGNGIAGLMTRVALAYAEDNQMWVVPLCPYMSAYLRRHPEHQPQVYAWSPKSRREK